MVTGGGEITVARIDFEGGTLDITAGDVTAERTINFFEGTFQTGNGTLSTAEFNVHGALEIDDGMIVSDALNVGGTLDLISGTMSAVAIDVDGALNLVGGTTLSTTDFNIDGALDVDDATISSNALQVGGTLDVHSGTVSSIATIDIEGTLKVNSGTISSDAVTVGGTLDLHSGMVSSVAFGVDGALEIDGGTISSDALNVGGTMDVHGGMVSSVALDVDGALKLDGGSISTTTFSVGGAFDYQSGSLQVTGDDVVVGLAGQLGPAFELTSAHDLEVTQNVVVDAGAGLTLSSNTVAAAAILNDGDLQIGALKVASDVGMIHNSGHIAGDGRIGAGLDNQAGGDLEAAAGTELRFTGSGNTNAGEINIDESSVEFTNSLINMAGGFIGGSGLLATGGLANAGLIEFTQDSDVLGDIDNMPGGQIIASGHSTLTLFDDVVHNGAEIRANSGSSIVFFGGMTGAAVLTGGGDFFLEGDTRPGNSPGLLDFDGNVTFGGLNTLEIELGGLTRVTEYDAVDVSGTLALGGALNVVLFDLGGGLFTPQLGNVFDIFDAGSIVGSFAGINLPSLQAGLLWNTSLLESAGELSVAAVPLPPSVWMLMSCAALLMWRRRPAP